MLKNSQTHLKLGTRGSALALVQAHSVAGAIRQSNPGVAVEIVTIQTLGDRFTGERLADAGGKALFVREIEETLLRDEIDLAVHSLKDVPGDIPFALTISAFPKREDARDCFLSLKFNSFEKLPKGATLGTTSPRREAQVLALRPDLKVKPIRGNVDTRLKKMESGNYDAVILAAAGLKRLGRAEVIRHYFEPEFFIPAVGQGILGVEVKRNRSDLIHLLREALNDLETEVIAKTERSFLQKMGGDCFTPLGAHTRVEGGVVHLLAWWGNPDGTKNIRVEKTAAVDEVEMLGAACAEEILNEIAAHKSA